MCKENLTSAGHSHGRALSVKKAGNIGARRDTQRPTKSRVLHDSGGVQIYHGAEHVPVEIFVDVHRICH